jgi:hypothetical protein
MNATELANKNAYQPIDDFVGYVRSRADADVTGILEVMKRRLHKHPIYKVLYGNATALDLVGDCEVLTARLIMERSSHRNPNCIYLNRQLQNLAWDEGLHRNLMDDWKLAQRKYVNRGLDYLLAVAQR